MGILTSGQRKPKKPFVYSTTELRKSAGEAFVTQITGQNTKVIMKEPTMV